eukprot:TRINITY_DN20657_c0_g1_i1.p1 TRINITY_DN20657_c0_g1~~TRINITY_DN20657_c0_g1_i1.p1  ORF type:complete len:407 (+),score=122.22 TRINITY_DN20657_c0_g1_i1:99-1319(+)
MLIAAMEGEMLRQTPPSGKRPAAARPQPHIVERQEDEKEEKLEDKAMALRIDTEMIHRAHSFKRRGGKDLKAAIAGGRACSVGSWVVRACTQDLTANTMMGGLSGWRCHKGLFHNAIITVAIVPNELISSGWTAGKIASYLEPATQHPNILRLLGWCDQAADAVVKSKRGPDAALHCLLFEGCKGVTLKDRNRIKSWEDRLTIVGSLSSALHHLSVDLPNGGEGYLRSTDLITEEGGTAKITGMSVVPLLQEAQTSSPVEEVSTLPSSPRSSPSWSPDGKEWTSFRLPSILKQNLTTTNILTQSNRHWYLRSLGLIILELIVARPLDIIKDSDLIDDFLTTPEESCERFFTRVHGPVPPVISQKLFSIAVRCLKGKGDIAQAHDRCTRLRQRYAKLCSKARAAETG